MGSRGHGQPCHRQDLGLVVMGPKRQWRTDENIDKRFLRQNFLQIEKQALSDGAMVVRKQLSPDGKVAQLRVMVLVAGGDTCYFDSSVALKMVRALAGRMARFVEARTIEQTVEFAIAGLEAFLRDQGAVKSDLPDGFLFTRPLCFHDLDNPAEPDPNLSEAIRSIYAKRKATTVTGAEK